MFVLYFKRPTDSRQRSFTVCVVVSVHVSSRLLQWWWCAFCATPSWSSTATDVGSTPALWCRAAPTLWDWSWWATSRWASCMIPLYWKCTLLVGVSRRVQTTSPTLLFVRSITPSLSTTWEPGWRSQQGCCLCACSVFSPTGWLWPPSTTGWPTSGWLWHWEPWSPSSSVSFTD